MKRNCRSGRNVYQVNDTWLDTSTCNLYQCTYDLKSASTRIDKKYIKCPRKGKKCPYPNTKGISQCCVYCKEKDYNPRAISDTNIAEHYCKRTCKINEGPKICRYKFQLEWYETLSRACYNCPLNRTDYQRPHCIAVDGIGRSLTVINRQLPGPSLEVCRGDVLEIDVENLLASDTTSIHWHGIHMNDTPYMDGVPHLTQCPISPHSTFRYTFRAAQIGTHFWHSHIGIQRSDGVLGPLIIRQPRSQDPHGMLYNFDLSEHQIVLQDWVHQPTISVFSAHHHSNGTNKPSNILINGKGRYYDFREKPHFSSAAQLQMPLANFNVKQGYRYRFRIINAGFLNCPIRMTIDNHSLLILSSDSYNVVPVEVDSLVIYAGERFDFVLKANRSINNYWMHFQGLLDCDEHFQSVFQMAILRYTNANSSEEPNGLIGYHKPTTKGIALNPLNIGSGVEGHLTIAELKAENNYSVEAAVADDILHQQPDYKFFVYYDFYAKDNPVYHPSDLYGINNTWGVRGRVYTPQLNHITMEYPLKPLLDSRFPPDESRFCNESSFIEQNIDCRIEFCKCHHVLQVALDSIVEIVIVDEGVTYDTNHPFHLHGSSFRVLAVERLGSSVSIETVRHFN